MLVADEAKRNSMTSGRNLQMTFSLLSGDRVQLQQVVLNLIMNAIEAMSDVADRPRELTIITRNTDPDQVVVSVEDSGPGLDPNAADKIFEPFYTTKSTGMGMGLSISRSIVQNHGGRLWASAKDGRAQASTLAFRSTRKKEHMPESPELTLLSRLWAGREWVRLTAETWRSCSWCCVKALAD